MKRQHIGLVAILAFAAFLLGPLPALAQVAPNMGTDLPQFGVLGGAGATGSTGLGTIVDGDVGSSPTSTILEFIGSTIPGPSRTAAPFIVHYVIDGVVNQAHLDAITAYNDMTAQGLLPAAQALGPQLNGQILGPGIYTFAAAADLAATGTLTLNGAGVFIFVVGTSLTTNVNSSFAGSADPCSVFWRVGSSAVLNSNNFFGTVIADQSVTVASANNMTGRAIGINGAVTMPGAGGNTVGGCAAPGIGCPVITVNPATLPNGSVGAVYGATVTASGGTAPYTFSVTAGTLPAGLTLNPATGAITGIPTTVATSNFTIRATDALGCFGNRAYSIAVGLAPVVPIGVPFLDFVGLAVLFVLLAGAGLFVMSRF